MLPTTDMSSSQLERKLGAVDAAALLVGSMIGSGIFIAPSLMAKNITAPGLYLGLWLLAGLFTLLGAFSYAELAAMMPEGRWPVCLSASRVRATHWLFVRLDAVSGHSVGLHRRRRDRLCQIPWHLSTLGWRGTTVAHALSRQSWPSWTVSSAQGVALMVIAVLTYINTRGVVAGAAVQNLFTGLKLLGLWGLLALIIILGKGSTANYLPLWSTTVPQVPGAVQAGFLAALGVAASKALFCYDAWNTVTFAAAEVRDPSRNLPKAIIGGTLVTTLTYVVAAAGYLYLFPLDQMARVPENRIAAEAARSLLGTSGWPAHCRCDPGVHLWLYQRHDPRWCPGLVRDGRRPAVFPRRWATEPQQGAGLGAGHARAVVGGADDVRQV
jgi:APA family basic amino acid/polyamine antiporter